MSAAAAMRISKGRSFWLIGVIAAVFAGLFLSICIGIVHDASLQELHPADAIVVFGAAEYAGRPSPVYRARLDHGFELYKRGVAPVVIATGGAGDDYLMRRGIAEPNLIAETQGSDTAQSAERVGVIMRANHMHSCIAVS